MLKSVAVVTGACAARSRKPYPFSSRMLPSLINARAAPGTLCADMRGSISASEAEESAADTEAASVTTATAIPTAHIASRRPHQLRFIVLAPIITIKFRGATCGAEVAAVKTGSVLLAADAQGRFSRLYRPRARRSPGASGAITECEGLPQTGHPEGAGKPVLKGSTISALETRHPIDTAPPVGEKMLLPHN